MADAGTEKNITGVAFTENPYAHTLLTANKEYVKDEVNAWVANQVSTVGGTLWGGFIYDQVKCERDTGLIIDAMLHDLEFGGTRETIKAAKAYWIGTQSQVLGQQTQTVLSLLQTKVIINDYVMDNTSYSSLQSVTSQTTNSNNGEAAAQTKVAELFDIITEVINNGLGAVPTNGGTGVVNITVATHNILERTKIRITEVGGTCCPKCLSGIRNSQPTASAANLSRS